MGNTSPLYLPWGIGGEKMTGRKSFLAVTLFFAAAVPFLPRQAGLENGEHRGGLGLTVPVVYRFNLFPEEARGGGNPPAPGIEGDSRQGLGAEGENRPASVSDGKKPPTPSQDGKNPSASGAGGGNTPVYRPDRENPPVSRSNRESQRVSGSDRKNHPASRTNGKNPPALRTDGKNLSGSTPSQQGKVPAAEEQFSPSLLFPVEGARLTSPFGPRGKGMHWGVDLAAPEGRPVRAAAAGKVVFAGWNGAYGLLIILEHSGFRTYYAHNSTLLVEKNRQVAAGEIIARVGRTGRATGSHLHFELEIQERKVNPLPYLVRKPEMAPGGSAGPETENGKKAIEKEKDSGNGEK